MKQTNHFINLLTGLLLFIAMLGLSACGEKQQASQQAAKSETPKAEKKVIVWKLAQTFQAQMVQKFTRSSVQKRIAHSLAASHHRGQITFGQPGGQLAGGAAHGLVAGEQHKRGAVGTFDVTADHLEANRIISISIRRRAGHAVQQDQLHLAAVIEGAVQPDHVALCQSDPRFEKIERSATADGQSGARENHASCGFE